MYIAVLIGAQFLLAALLVLSTRWSQLSGVAFLLATPGIGLAIWSWLTVGLRRLRIQPTTDAATRLITDGPYALVRHPMYVGLLWFTVALLISPLVWWRVVAWLALLAVLAAKSRVEENAMSERFAEYGRYRQRVGGLLPKFFR